MMPHPPKEALRGGAKIRRLFADPKGEEAKYFRKNGYYPDHASVAFKDEVLKQNPGSRERHCCFRQSQSGLHGILRRPELVAFRLGAASFRGGAKRLRRGSLAPWS